MTGLASSWRQSVFGCRSALDPHVDGKAFKAGFFGPLGYRHRSPECREKPSRAPVQRLFLNRGPSAVVRIIVTIVIDAIKLMCRAWRSAHIVEKVGIGLAPSLADLDAASAVLRPSVHARIRASRDHSPPRIPFFRASAVACLAMFPIAFHGRNVTRGIRL